MTHRIYVFVFFIRKGLEDLQTVERERGWLGVFVVVAIRTLST